jgi:molybdopterin-guanine dinucleotide biosynthesis protein A
MGRDKAFLEFEGEPLWQRQVATLRALSPEQLLIAGPRREEWIAFEVIADEIAEAGPLAGVAAALQKCTAPHLVVLAVDLPMVTADFFRALLELCEEEQGVVPTAADATEPLAAIYPIAAFPLATAALRRGEFAMQKFVRDAIAQGLMREREILPEEMELFANLNTPADYERLRQREICRYR